MENLESEVQISENELKKARKDFKALSYVCHFGGEIGLLYCLGTGTVIPMIKDFIQQTQNFRFEEGLAKIFMGIAVYSILQIPAFYFKGFSMSEEDNRALAKNNETMDGKSEIGKWFGKKFSEFHNNVADNYETSNRILNTYTRLKRMILGNKNARTS